MNEFSDPTFKTRTGHMDSRASTAGRVYEMLMKLFSFIFHPGEKKRTTLKRFRRKAAC